MQNGDLEEENASDNIFIGIRRTCNNVCVSYNKIEMKRILLQSKGWDLSKTPSCPCFSNCVHKTLDLQGFDLHFLNKRTV